MKSRPKPESISATIVQAGSVYQVNTICRQGADDVIVFLHGLGCSSRTFEEVWNRSELGIYSVLCIDYLGHGASEAPKNFGYSVEEHARACATVMASYRDRPIHLVGHSLGGAVALFLPDSITNSVVSFANLEGNLNPEDCIFGSRRASEKSFETFESQVLPAFRASSTTWCESGLDVADPAAFYRTARSLVDLSDNGVLLDRFLSWEGKKAYFYGSENSNHPTIRTVSDIDQFEIPDSGHFMMKDNPDEFYRSLSDFLTR